MVDVAHVSKPQDLPLIIARLLVHLSRAAVNDYGVIDFSGGEEGEFLFQHLPLVLAEAQLLENDFHILLLLHILELADAHRRLLDELLEFRNLHDTKMDDLLRSMSHLDVGGGTIVGVDPTWTAALNGIEPYPFTIRGQPPRVDIVINLPSDFMNTLENIQRYCATLIQLRRELKTTIIPTGTKLKDSSFRIDPMGDGSFIAQLHAEW